MTPAAPTRTVTPVWSAAGDRVVAFEGRAAHTSAAAAWAAAGQPPSGFFRRQTTIVCDRFGATATWRDEEIPPAPDDPFDAPFLVPA